MQDVRDFDNIPNDLKELSQWVTWIPEETEEGKFTKVSYSPLTPHRAKSTDPETWATYDAAIDHLRVTPGAGGIAFALTEPYCGIDLDHCVDENGIAGWAQEIINTLNSYAELSQSGTGIHILVRGKLPGTRCVCTKWEGESFSNGEKIEVYDHSRFFCMTGNRISAKSIIEERELGEFYVKLFPEPEKDYHDIATLSAKSDQRVLDLCGKAANSAKFDALWSGQRGMPEYQDDDSNEDFALLGIMEFYTTDVTQLARLFRASGLFRPYPEKARDYPERSARNIVKANIGREHYTDPIEGEIKDVKFANQRKLKREPVSECPPLPDHLRITGEKAELAATAGGWLQDYVEYAKQASPLTPTSFHTAVGMAISSLAIARRVYLGWGRKRIYPNLALMYLGPSSNEAKTVALDVAKDLIYRANLHTFLLDDSYTPEALALDLTATYRESYETWDSETQQLWLEERAIAAQRGMLLDEASGLLGSFDREFTSQLLPMILKLYDCPERYPVPATISRGRGVIKSPYFTIFGTTTYESVINNLNKSELWLNGFFARFALVTSSKDWQWKYRPPPIDIPEKVLSRLQFVAKKLLPLPVAEVVSASGDFSEDKEKDKEKDDHKVVNVYPELSEFAVEYTDAAFQYSEAYAKTMMFDWQHGDTLSRIFKASYFRFGTLLDKVSMCLATFDAEELPIRVELKHVYRAQQIVEEWREGLHTVFMGIQGTHEVTLEERVKQCIFARSQEWLSRRDLGRALNKKWEELESTIEELLEKRVIDSRVATNPDGSKKSGPPSIEYCLLVEDF